MDGGEPHFIRLIDIWQRVVNEQAFPRRSSNLVQNDSIDLRLWLDESHRAGNNHVIEQVKKIIFCARVWECFCRPITKSIKRVSSLLEPFQYFHGAGKCLAN